MNNTLSAKFVSQYKYNFFDGNVVTEYLYSMPSVIQYALYVKQTKQNKQTKTKTKTKQKILKKETSCNKAKNWSWVKSCDVMKQIVPLSVSLSIQTTGCDGSLMIFLSISWRLTCTSPGWWQVSTNNSLCSSVCCFLFLSCLVTAPNQIVIGVHVILVYY